MKTIYISSLSPNAQRKAERTPEGHTVYAIKMRRGHAVISVEAQHEELFERQHPDALRVDFSEGEH